MASFGGLFRRGRRDVLLTKESCTEKNELRDILRVHNWINNFTVNEIQSIFHWISLIVEILRKYSQDIYTFLCFMCFITVIWQKIHILIDHWIYFTRLGIELDIEHNSGEKSDTTIRDALKQILLHSFSHITDVSFFLFIIPWLSYSSYTYIIIT